MFSSIAFFTVLGIPIAAYLGIITFLCLILTASISTMNKRKIHIISMKWHPRMAYLTIIFALCHGLLILLASIA